MITLRFDVSAQSNQGMKRTNNEDFVTFFEPADPEILDASGRLFIVADGVGGAAQGEIASKYAAEKVLFEYYQNPQVKPADRLATAMRQAGNDIYNNAVQSGNPKMASTMVVAAIIQNQLVVTNVGDSRAYLIHSGKISQISKDHSYVGEMVRMGILTEQESLESNIKNRITRSIGGEMNVQVDRFEENLLQPGDCILLCTDGLTRYLVSNDLLPLVSEGSAEEVTSRLIRYANQKGGEDNISVIFIKVEESQETTLSGPPIPLPLPPTPLHQPQKSAQTMAVKIEQPPTREIAIPAGRSVREPETKKIRIPARKPRISNKWVIGLVIVGLLFFIVIILVAISVFAFENSFLGLERLFRAPTATHTPIPIPPTAVLPPLKPAIPTTQTTPDRPAPTPSPISMSTIESSSLTPVRPTITNSPTVINITPTIPLLKRCIYTADQNDSLSTILQKFNLPFLEQIPYYRYSQCTPTLCTGRTVITNNRQILPGWNIEIREADNSSLCEKGKGKWLSVVE